MSANAKPKPRRKMSAMAAHAETEMFGNGLLEVLRICAKVDGAELKRLADCFDRRTKAVQSLAALKQPIPHSNN